MTTNALNLHTRDLITRAIHDVSARSQQLPITHPMQPVLDELLNELAQLNWQVVTDDVRQLADSINEHVGELEKLTKQIQKTTAELQELSTTLGQVADAVGFLLDTYTSAASLGLLSFLIKPSTTPS